MSPSGGIKDDTESNTLQQLLGHFHLSTNKNIFSGVKVMNHICSRYCNKVVVVVVVCLLVHFEYF